MQYNILLFLYLQVDVGVKISPVKTTANQKKPKHLQSSAYPTQDVRNFFKPNKIIKFTSVESESIHDQTSIAQDLNETNSIDMSKILPALQAFDRVKHHVFKKSTRSAKFQIPSISEIVFQNGAPIELKKYALQCNADVTQRHLNAETGNCATNDQSQRELRKNIILSHRNVRPDVLTDFKFVFDGLVSNVPFDFVENLEKCVDEDLLDIYSDQPPLSAVPKFTQCTEFGMDTQMPYIENVSNYQSQVLSPIQQKLPLQSSTPFKTVAEQTGFTTPLKSSNESVQISSNKKKSEPRSCKKSEPRSRKKSESRLCKGSPIKRAFQRSIEIQQQKQKQAPVVRTVNTADILAYFMLNDVFDIFNDEIVSENVTPERPLKSSGKSDNFCIDTSDLFRDISRNDESAIEVKRCSPVRNDTLRTDMASGTQYTISQILNIVNDGNKAQEHVITSPSKVSVKQKLRKLELDKFTHIFDDELLATQAADMIEPNADDSLSEVILPSQAPSVWASYSFKAQKAKQSSSLQLPAKPTTRQLSENMFEVTKRSASVKSLKENESPGKNLKPNTTSLLPAKILCPQVSADMFEETINSVNCVSLKGIAVPKEAIFESPTKASPASCVTVDTSPSVLSGRTNISRLKLHRLKNINSMQMPAKPTAVFATRSEQVTSHTTSSAMVNLENRFNAKKDTSGPSNRMEATNKTGK